ncbi:MAG: FGGY family carbohydrate kinase [Actinobacteria bacterium]|nr:FGGY family carbohydrate kinase [Actinomycetota bacterium]
MSLMGVDIGMTGSKAVIFSEDGNILAKAYREYDIIYLDQEKCEWDPDVIWRAVVEIIREATSKSDDPVKALSVSVSADDVFPADENGDKLYNIISGYDMRGLEYGKLLADSIGERRFVSLTGHSPLLMPQSIHRILWFKDHEPGIFERTWKFLCLEEFFFTRLGIRPVTDYSVAARTLYFDINRRKWSDEILDVIGIPKEKLPEVVPPQTIIEEVPAKRANDLGLPEGVLAVTGGFDQACAALGAGATTPGMSALGMGTVICMSVIFDRAAESLLSKDIDYPYCNYVVDDYLFALSMSFSCGSVLKWYRDVLGAGIKKEAQRLGLDVYEYINKNLPEESSRLFLLPHFEGAQNPWWNPNSKGAVIGLTLDSNRWDIAKAIFEGVAFDLYINMNRMESMGIPIGNLRAIGGGSRSSVWLQTIVDISGRQVQTLQIDEGGCLAAAMMAGVVTGVYRSIEEAVERFVKIKETYKPNPDMHARYLKRFEIYKEIYPALAAINEQIV